MLVVPGGHWLTTGEAGRRLGISREWVRQLVQRGILDGQMTHAGTLIDPASVDAYAAQRDTAARTRVGDKIADVVREAERVHAVVSSEAIEQLRRAREVVAPTNRCYWQEQTGFTQPDEVLDWLRDAREQVNGGRPLPGNSTDIIRAFREGRPDDA